MRQSSSQLRSLRRSTASAQLQAALHALDQELEQRTGEKEAALEVALSRTLSPVLRTAYEERAEAAIKACEELGKRRITVQIGMDALDAQARLVLLALQSPHLDPSRWQETAVYQALKRALHLLIAEAILVETAPDTFCIELGLFTPESLIVREFTTGGSAWESNPPARLVTPPNHFEDGDRHRPTSAPVRMLPDKVTHVKPDSSGRLTSLG